MEKPIHLFRRANPYSLLRMVHADKAIVALLEKVPYGGKHVTVSLETVATSLIRKSIVCIDDVERLGSGITVDELIVLVRELKVES